MDTKLLVDFEQFDNLIEPSVVLSKPNDHIDVYSGLFSLTSGEFAATINGKVWFRWYPSQAVVFHGEVQYESSPIIALDLGTRFDMAIGIDRIGQASLTGIKHSGSILIQGRIVGPAIVGDGTIKVGEAFFSIPNLRNFFGATVKKVIGDKTNLLRSRLSFNVDSYQIDIDKVSDYTARYQELKTTGGYDILYGGRVTKAKGTMDVTEARGLLELFCGFLSFLNGRRCAPIFFQAKHEGEKIWFDYSGNISDQFESVFSWPSFISTDGLDDMWKAWYKLSKDELDKDFLITVVHWYLEANTQAGRVEGAIALVQNGLELLFNWLIVEQQGLIKGPDAGNIQAANKIRLVLNHLNIKFSVPKELANLSAYAHSFSDPIDGPESFVRIRNAIVHANEEKRRMLKEIDLKKRYEALQLGLWYVELAILKILNFNGTYCNRTKAVKGVGSNEVVVPWA